MEGVTVRVGSRPFPTFSRERLVADRGRRRQPGKVKEAKAPNGGSAMLDIVQIKHVKR